MKITLETQDVKRAIREYVENRRIIQPETKIDMDITKLRTGEDIRVELTILEDEEFGITPNNSVEEPTTETEELTSESPFGNALDK